MKKKIDLYLIYLYYILEVCLYIGYRFWTIYGGTEKGNAVYTFLVILVNFYSTVCLLYVILLAYYMRKKKLSINIKRNTILLSVILLFDLLVYGFDRILTMFSNFPQFYMICLMCVAHAIIYIRDKRKPLKNEEQIKKYKNHFLINFFIKARNIKEFHASQTYSLDGMLYLLKKVFSMIGVRELFIWIVKKLEK